MGKDTIEKNAIITKCSFERYDYKSNTIKMRFDSGGDDENTINHAEINIDNFDNLIKFMEAVGVRKWEDIQGHYVRIMVCGKKVIRIRDILQDYHIFEV